MKKKRSKFGDQVFIAMRLEVVDMIDADTIVMEPLTVIVKVVVRMGGKEVRGE